MDQYLQLLSTALHGKPKPSRAKLLSTGELVGTRAVFGAFARYPLCDAQGTPTMPLVTTKRVSFRWVAEELLWFLRGESNIRSLQEKGVTIWDEWADENGDVGPIYGVQWRSWPNGDQPAIDQIANAIHLLRTDPHSRRIVVSAWNVAQLSEMALPPCHLLFQFGVIEGGLHCHLTMRSADAFLGVPYNIASYALFTHMIAAQTGLRAESLAVSYGDLHLYDNHREQAALQLARTPYAMPGFSINPDVKNIDRYQASDFQIVNYQSHPAIYAEVAV